ncbi:MAG: S8 family serine peptidase [Candidatus Roizmanbacteria bacterium]|nr:S8 family serine peptidase [Candidatus Roizmanbacteria bacterium]
MHEKMGFFNRSLLALGIAALSAVSVPTAHAQDSAPNDPLFPQQWNLAPASQHGTGWIDAYHYLENRNSLFSPVVVAVLDAGINPHPDLPASALWTNPDEIPHNELDDDHNGYVDDVHGCSFLPYQSEGCSDLSDNSYAQHGMTVTGVMAQESDNGIGSAGSLPNLPITYIPIRIMQKEGYVNYSDVVLGLEYVSALIEQGVPVRVINMSFSGFKEAHNLPRGDELLAQLHEQGVVLVAGSGNDGTDELGWPARNPHVLPVGAYGKDGTTLPLTTTGPGMVLAPGENIETVCYGNAPDYPADQCRPSGTSMAAPHVSDLAAIIASAKPELSSDEILAIIKKTTRERKIDMMAALRETLDLQQTFMPLVIK